MIEGHGKWKERLVALLRAGDATSEEIALELYGIADRAHTSLASAHVSHLIKQGVVVKKAKMAQDGRPGTPRLLYGLAV